MSPARLAPPFAPQLSPNYSAVASAPPLSAAYTPTSSLSHTIIVALAAVAAIAIAIATVTTTAKAPRSDGCSPRDSDIALPEIPEA